MNTYPRIDDAMLVPFRAIEAHLKRDPTYLEKAPYADSVRSFLAKRLGEQTAPERPEYDDDDLLGEISWLYNEVKRASSTTASADPKDRFQMFKTASDQLTKLVSLRERQLNVRYMADFQRAVLELLESVITPGQRSDFIELMGKYIDLQGDRTALLGQGDVSDPVEAEGEGPGA